MLHRHDMHMALASRAALRLAGLDHASPDPPGGSLDRDPATGQLTGILRCPPDPVYGKTYTAVSRVLRVCTECCIGP